EHAFAWIARCEHVESVLTHLEGRGFGRDDAVFVPYSAKGNWTRRYPHAAPCLECTEGGEIVVYLNYRPHPNGLGELGGDEPEPEAAATDDGNGARDREGRNFAKRRKKPPTAAGALLTGPERDELHVEIYAYFHWLRGLLAGIEKRAAAAAKDDGADAPEGTRRKGGGGERRMRGVDPDGLGNVLDAMESSISVLPGVAGRLDRIEQARGEEKAPEDDAEHPPPFLEEDLGEALARLARSRGYDRRNRRRMAKTRRQRKERTQFDVMFERLERYQEERGDCLVPKSHDPEVSGLVG
ncbi:hypothetical protein ACHAWF_011812, partial [Thalassiosira exigua]